MGSPPSHRKRDNLATNEIEGWREREREKYETPIIKTHTRASSLQTAELYRMGFQRYRDHHGGSRDPYAQKWLLLLFPLLLRCGGSPLGNEGWPVANAVQSNVAMSKEGKKRENIAFSKRKKFFLSSGVSLFSFRGEAAKRRKVVSASIRTFTHGFFKCSLRTDESYIRVRVS